MSRLGDSLRVAGTIELMAGWPLRQPLAQARCHMLARRIETLLQACATRACRHEGGQPGAVTRAGLAPATPTDVPLIGQTTPWTKLWLNAGHGTLGWTAWRRLGQAHGSA